MNRAAIQQAAVDTSITAAKPSRTPKEKNADDKFMNMLSDAINGKRDEKVEPPEQAEEPVKTENEVDQPPEQAQPDEQPSAPDHEDSTAYEQQAVAAAMQMQGILPVIVGVPQTEVPEELIAAPLLTGTQEVQAGLAVQGEVAASDGFQADAAQDIPGREPQAEKVTAERPQTAEAKTEDEKIEVQSRPSEKTAPRTARTEEPAPDSRINQQQPTAEPQTVQRHTIQQEPATVQNEAVKDTTSETVETAGNTEPAVQALRQQRPAVPMRQMRTPRETEAAQTKFDGMIARASRELNQGLAAQEVQTEADVPEETPIAEQPVVLETKPQEAVKQADVPETEAKPEEDVKPAAQATVQKNVKAPVMEQRPRQEISKSDETLLGMTQQKQPEITHEVIRTEAVPQSPQQVQMPDQAEQIKAQVLRSMENDKTEFQMQLQPEELGKVNVKMILEGGKLSVEIAAVNPKSAEMLSRQAESLAASLKASGADVSSIDVVTATENVSAQMNSEYNLDHFQSKGNGQGQNGHSRGTGTTGNTGENAERAEREAPEAPRRILNYAV